MVELFYYETRGKNCHKLLRYEGCPNKVLLFPFEGWAQPAVSSYWLIKLPWWSRRRCKIVEVCGSKKTSTKAKVVYTGNGDMAVVGKFKKSMEPDFKLCLTTNVSNADFQLGYSMTGSLERGNRKDGTMEMTHHAMIKRKGY